MISAESETKKLIRPTVADLAALLQSYPQDMPVRIEDADTLWEIRIIRVRVEPFFQGEPDALVLFGEYSEMRSQLSP